jgi:hypothetical protein
MCPACLTMAAALAAILTSSGGVLALVVTRL